MIEAGSDIYFNCSLFPTLTHTISVRLSLLLSHAHAHTHTHTHTHTLPRHPHKSVLQWSGPASNRKTKPISPPSLTATHTHAQTQKQRQKNTHTHTHTHHTDQQS